MSIHLSVCPFRQWPQRGWWPMLSYIRGIFSSFLGSSPEGANVLCFHTGDISPPTPPSPYPPPGPNTQNQPLGPKPSPEAQNLAQIRRLQPNLSLKAQIPAWRLKSQPRGSNPSLEAQIPASRPKSQPQSLHPSILAYYPVYRLRSQPWGSNTASRLKSQPPN